MSQEPSSVAATQPPSHENQGAGQFNSMQAAMVFQKSAQQVEAEKAAQASLIWGIIGIFVLPFIFGPIAIIQANKAERLGAAATAGKIIGWIVTILGVIGLLLVILFLVGAIGLAGSAASA